MLQEYEGGCQMPSYEGLLTLLTNHLSKGLFDNFPANKTQRNDPRLDLISNPIQKVTDTVPIPLQHDGSLMNKVQTDMGANEPSNTQILPQVGMPGNIVQFPEFQVPMLQSGSTAFDISAYPPLDSGMDSGVFSTQPLQYPFEPMTSLDTIMDFSAFGGTGVSSGYSPQSSDSMDVFDFFSAGDPSADPFFSIQPQDSDMELGLDATGNTTAWAL